MANLAGRSAIMAERLVVHSGVGGFVGF